MKRVVMAAITILFLFLTHNLHAEPVLERFCQKNRILNIAVHENHLWSNTSDVIVKWDTRNENFIEYSHEDIGKDVTLEAEFSSPLKVNHKGDIYIHGHLWVYWLDGGTWSRMPLYPYDMAFQSDGLLWSDASNGNISCWVPGERDPRITLPFEGDYLDVDSNDAVWIARRKTTDDPLGGVVRIKGDGMEQFGIKDGLLSDENTDVYIDDDDNVWVGTMNGLSHFDGATWTNRVNPDLFDDTSIYDMALDSRGVLWALSRYRSYISSPTKIVSYEGSNWQDMTPPLEILDGYNNTFPEIFTGVEVDEHDVVWISSYHGIFRYDDNEWTVWQNGAGPLNNNIKMAFVDSQNRKWFHCGLRPQGMTVFDGQDWSYFYSPNDSNMFQWVSGIAEDSEGNVWVLGEGVAQFDKNATLTIVDNDINGTVMLIDAMDTVWIGETYKGIHQYDGSSWTHYSGEDIGCVIDEMKCGIIDSYNTKWFVTPEVLISYDNNIWAWEETPVRGADILCADKNHGIWIARTQKDDKGVYYYDGEAWTDHLTIGGPVDIRCMTVDKDNELWVGTDNGVWSYIDGEWWQHTDEHAPTGRIHLSVVGGNNTMWIVDYSGYAFSYDGSEWRRHGNLGGKNCIAEDNNGDIWIGSTSGVYRYTPDPVITAVERDPSPTPIALTTHPNPFNLTTAIGFMIQTDGLVTLAVYNLAGQKVRTLLDGPLTAGSHTIVWDGTDDNGRSVAAGVYLTRLTAGDMTATGKMALVK